MKAIRFVVAIGCALAAGSLFAQAGADVVKAKGCLNCHDVDKKKAGPSFKESAAKYKGDAGAAAKIVGEMKAGKPHPKVAASDADLKAAVDYALSQK